MAYNPNNPNGQATMANSAPVVIASDQSSIPINDASGSITIDNGNLTSLDTKTATAKTTDYDTGAGTDTVQMTGIALPASGGAVAGGTSTNPVRTDPTGTTTQPVSGTVTANAGTNLNTSALATSANLTAGTMKTQVVDGSGNVIGATSNAFDVNIKSNNASGLVSTNNSSSTNITGSAAFTGTGEDVTQYSEMRVSVFSSHASATNGLSIQQSSDNTNWDITDTYTIPATTGKTFVVPRQAKFFRVVYTNGATTTTSFRLQVILNRTGSASSSQRTQDAYTNETDMDQSWAFLSAWNGTTWDRVPGDTTGLKVKQNAGTATLSNVAGSATSVTLLAANTARIGATITNDSSALLYIKFGTTASTTSYTVVLAGAASAPFSYYEVPAGYTGRIDGIWASAAGNARVTELT